jgi:uncharacterized protein (DUF433 family)
LVRLPAYSVRRWLDGYRYYRKGEVQEQPPLWSPQLDKIDDQLEIGFRDLIELRFVKAFLDEGVRLETIRHCLAVATEFVNDDRPFSTQRFRTDGKTIFLESIAQAGDEHLLDLKDKQFVFRRVVERTFKDLDIEDGAVTRWRPYNGKSSVAIDPRRAFGQPILDRYGITTVALAEAVEAEGSIERAAWAFEVTSAAVRDAVGFERQLRAGRF